jgi:GH25 family lysozyme M1 (1,4-beta-N-acetylmuramidase)
MVILGPDVSNWQGTPNMVAVAASGNDYVICKATEGTGYVDPTMPANRANGHAAGMLVGLYHFASIGDVGAEVRAFLNAVGALRPGEFLVLDFERPAGDPPGWCKAWLDGVQAATGQRALIYMNQSAASGSNWSAVAAAGYALWLAKYDGDPWTQGSVPWWGKPAMKQYTDAAQVPGIAGNCDRNAFYGSRDDLLALIGGDDMFTDQDSFRLEQAYNFLMMAADAFGGKSLADKINALPTDVWWNTTVIRGKDAKGNEIRVSALQELADAKTQVIAANAALATLAGQLAKLQGADPAAIQQAVKDAVGQALKDNTVHVDVNVSGQGTPAG